MKVNMHFSRLNLRASQDKTAYIVRDIVMSVIAKLLWQHFDFKDGQLMNAQWQNAVKRVNFLCKKKCLKQSRFMFFSGRVFDKSCQGSSAYTLLTAACITKSKPPLPEFKRSSLFVFFSLFSPFFLAPISLSWFFLLPEFLARPSPARDPKSDLFTLFHLSLL